MTTNNSERRRLCLTVAEVAEMTGSSKSSIYRAIKRGGIPTVRMGSGRIMIPRKPFLRLFGGDPDA